MSEVFIILGIIGCLAVIMTVVGNGQEKSASPSSLSSLSRLTKEQQRACYEEFQRLMREDTPETREKIKEERKQRRLEDPNVIQGVTGEFEIDVSYDTTSLHLYNESGNSLYLVFSPYRLKELHQLFMSGHGSFQENRGLLEVYYHSHTKTLTLTGGDIQNHNPRYNVIANFNQDQIRQIRELITKLIEEQMFVDDILEQ